MPFSCLMLVSLLCLVDFPAHQNIYVQVRSFSSFRSERFWLKIDIQLLALLIFNFCLRRMESLQGGKTDREQLTMAKLMSIWFNFDNYWYNILVVDYIIRTNETSIIWNYLWCRYSLFGSGLYLPNNPGRDLCIRSSDILWKDHEWSLQKSSGWPQSANELPQDEVLQSCCSWILWLELLGWWHFPRTFFVKIESGGPNTFYRNVDVFFFELPISFNSQWKRRDIICGWKTMRSFFGLHNFQ